MYSVFSIPFIRYYRYRTNTGRLSPGNHGNTNSFSKRTLDPNHDDDVHTNNNTPRQQYVDTIHRQCVIDLATAVILIAGNLTNRIPQLTPPVPKRLVFAYFYCLFWRTDIIFYVLAAVSSYNLAAIAIERYLAVLHPMWYRVNITKTKQLLLGGGLWAIAPFAQMTWTITARR